MDANYVRIDDALQVYNNTMVDDVAEGLLYLMQYMYDAAYDVAVVQDARQAMQEVAYVTLTQPPKPTLPGLRDVYVHIDVIRDDCGAELLSLFFLALMFAFSCASCCSRRGVDATTVAPVEVVVEDKHDKQDGRIVSV